MRKAFRDTLAFLVSLSLPIPLWGENKELVQLSAQIQALQNQAFRFQTSVHEGIGLMSNFAASNKEKLDGLEKNIETLQEQMNRQNRLEQEKLDQLLSNIKAMNGAAGDLRITLHNVALLSNKATAETAQIVSQVPSSSESASVLPSNKKTNSTSKGEPKVPERASNENAVLFESALENYRSRDFEVAANQFTKYLKSDSESQTADRAHFYLGQIEFEQKDFEGALEDYTTVANRLSDTKEAATAQYRKALCLLEVGRTDEGVAELHSVASAYPGSAEARQAISKLHSLHSSSTQAPK
jgi:TolA-binding protein